MNVEQRGIIASEVTSSEFVFCQNWGEASQAQLCVNMIKCGDVWVDYQRVHLAKHWGTFCIFIKEFDKNFLSLALSVIYFIHSVFQTRHSYMCAIRHILD